MNTADVDQIKKIVGTSVAIDPCAVCGGQAALESVADLGDRTATIQLRCHGMTSSRQVKASNAIEIRIVPFDNVQKPERAKDLLGGMVTGPFRGGIVR